jgi:NADH:ubiquinone oxidoreductase subunit 2 (subunit N)
MSAFKRNSSYSIESGLKYFIIGALSSAFFLFGSSLIYGCLGSLMLDDFRMFFSLLSLPEQNNLHLESATVLSPSTFSSILSCSAFFGESFQIKLPQLYSTTPDNLIDWYYLNCEKEALFKFFPSNFLQSGCNADFLVYPIFSYFIIDFLTSIFVLDWITTNEFGYGLFSFYYEINCTKSFLTFELFSSLFDVVKTTSGKSLTFFQQLSELYMVSKASALAVIDSSTVNLNLVSIGFFLICVSLFIKLSIAPFHFWSLDVYEGSPNTTTFFFAVIPKISLFVLLMRFCYASFYEIFINDFQIYFLALAALNIFVGAFGGLEQRKLKTLLAYSSISHTGYLLLSFSTGNVEGIRMMFYYLAIYMISGLCFWAVYLFLIQKRDVYYNKNNKELGDLILLKESNPMLALILVMTLFSLAGIPPLVGFLIKVGVFSVAVKSSTYLVSIVSIVLSVISTFYYIRLIKVLYFENTLVGKLYTPITTLKALLISLLALFLIILFLNPMVIYLLFYKAML